MTNKEDVVPELIDTEVTLLKGQQLEISPGVFVTVTSAGGGKTQIGITAPVEINILRAELSHPTKE